MDTIHYTIVITPLYLYSLLAIVQQFLMDQYDGYTCILQSRSKGQSQILSESVGRGMSEK